MEFLRLRKSKRWTQMLSKMLLLLFFNAIWRKVTTLNYKERGNCWMHDGINCVKELLEVVVCSRSTTCPTFGGSKEAFHFFSSSASKSANSALPFLSPLCSPQQQTPSPSLPPPSWLNISNGSSSGVGSSVSPKSTDGEGEKDNSSSHLTNRKNNKMEQYQQHFRHTMPRNFPNARRDVFNAKKLIREERNYDFQSVDCWRRWSSLRKMPTAKSANGTKGAGTLPKREGKRTEEGDNGDEEGLRRDEQGRIIVDRREWRQFLAEQRTPSSRRVENRIRLLHTCADGNHQNNNETDDEFEQYGKNRTRSKKPMFIVVDDDGEGRTGRRECPRQGRHHNAFEDKNRRTNGWRHILVV